MIEGLRDGLMTAPATAAELPLIDLMELPSPRTDSAATRMRRGIDNRDEGEFGESWIHMLAAAAGLEIKTARTEKTKIDCVLTYPHEIYLQPRWSISGQIKTVIEPRFENGHIVYDLDADTHRELAGLRYEYQFLFLVAACKEREWWIHNHETFDALSHGAYWYSLRHESPTGNKSKQVIRIPVGRRLSPASLRDLIFSTADDWHATFKKNGG
ncbi:DUF4365 domain-containing protein [Parafrankia elaeagni]|uniref:DUF4365 domain-containing protein n=1 Tax=Parafrankia elaeagni TaxID=222534 RepID=UPI001E482869|nr:DUF4365 domain-containing protein [Parafrankia elaeagni]